MQAKMGSIIKVFFLKKTQQEKPLLWYIINIIGKTKEQKTAAGGARKENTICTDLTN
jgi:hypothetical protein